MLKILINDQPVDLEGVKFNLQLNSPFPFTPEDGLVEGSFAFGVIFPATPANKKIFGFPHRLESFPDSQRDFTGQLYFDGRMLFPVIVTLTESSDFSYKGNIKVNLGYYANLIGDKSLRDLVYDGTVSIGDDTDDVVAHANAVVAQDYPDVAYNFPIVYHPRFYGEENKMNPSWFGYMNFYIHGSGFQKNVVDNGDELRNYYNLVPWPYLFKVLTHCFSEFGYKVTGPVLADQELARLIIYNNFALDLITDRYKSVVAATSDQHIPDYAQLTFANVIENIDDPYETVTFSYQILVGGNVHIEANYLVQIPYNEDECTFEIFFKLNDDSIGYYSFNVVDDQVNEIKVSFDATVLEADIGKSIKAYAMVTFGGIAVSSYIKEGSQWSAQNIPYSQLNNYATTINLANHVPDMKISAFLVALQKAFGIVYHFNFKTRDVELFFLKDILASTQEDVYSDLTQRSSKLSGFRESKSYKLSFAWNSADENTKENFIPYDRARLIGTFDTLAELPTISIEGSMAIIRNLNAVYRYETEGWAWFTDLHYPLQLGDGVTPVTMEATPLMMWENDDNPAMPKVYPRILQEGSSAHLGLKDFGLHLLFYRGLQDDVNGHSYPFASCTKYSPTGTVIGNYEFILDSADGLYYTFLEAYYNFIMNRTRPVEFDRYFSASGIHEISFIRKKRVFQHVFLLKEISIPISMNSIGTANMKLQKI